MCSKLVFVAVCAAIAMATADDAANLTQWYDAEVSMYEGPAIQARVIGGQPAARHQLPWHVLIGIETVRTDYFSPSRWCAGSLISGHWVLTEANALRQGGRYEVLFGSVDREDRRHVRRSDRAFFHPRSRAGQGNFNVALLQLNRAFTDFDKNVRPVQLARPDDDYQGRFGWVSGFGSPGTNEIEMLLMIIMMN